MHEESGPRAMARRRLLGLLGAAGASSLWLAAGASADEPRTGTPSAPPAPAKPAAGAPAGAEGGPSPEARDLARIAERRYGRHLQAGQLEELTSEIHDNLEAGGRLRQVRLANADEPDFLYRAEP